MNENEIGQKIREIIREEIKLFLCDLKADMVNYFKWGNDYGSQTGNSNFSFEIGEIKDAFIQDIREKRENSIASQIVREAMFNNEENHIDEYISSIIMSSLKEELEVGHNKFLIVESIINAIKEYKPTLYRVLKEEANKTSRTDLIDLD